MAKKKRVGKKTDKAFAVFNGITLALIAICVGMVVFANLPNWLGVA